MVSFLSRIALALLLLTGVASAQQLAPIHVLSTNTTNPNIIFAKKGLVGQIVTINTTTTIYYLKLYDKATAPTCGTDTPVWTLPVPYGASNAGGGISIPIPLPLLFVNGIGICLTGGIADNDTTPAAAGVAINLGVSGR